VPEHFSEIKEIASMFEKMLKLLPGIGLFIDFRGGRGLFVAFDQRRCGGAKTRHYA
jgi:hypothetical protein